MYPTHPTELFTVHGRTLIAEASELPRPLCGKIYDDACDLGFALRSHVTGAVKKFRMKDEIRDADGDLQVSIFEPLDLSLRAYGLEVHILND